MIMLIILIAIVNSAASRNTSNLIRNANLTAPQPVPINGWKNFTSLEGWNCNTICIILECHRYSNSVGCLGSYLDLSSWRKI